LVSLYSVDSEQLETELRQKDAALEETMAAAAAASGGRDKQVSCCC
jgi:hypothetical protein